MTNKYDDPIDPAELAGAVYYIAQRHRAEDRPLEVLAEEVVHERFRARLMADRRRSYKSRLYGSRHRDLPSGPTLARKRDRRRRR